MSSSMGSASPWHEKHAPKPELPCVEHRVLDQHDGAGDDAQAIAHRHVILKYAANAMLLFLFLAYFAPRPRNPFISKLSSRFRVRIAGFSSEHTIPDLYTATLEDLNVGLKQGHFNSQDLVSAYFARIEEVNDDIRAVLEINPHAMAEAKLLDLARTEGRCRGPLHGIPILLKDNIATARLDDTYMNTTAGSYALLGSFPLSDSTVVANLKRAGAIILGKTNLTEWSAHRSRNGTQGWSARGGQCEGVYVKAQDPSGSSSGSASASALGLALASIGTETSGSIIAPAQRGNLCAIKPTVGLVSRHLVIPISEAHDTVGPMARDCKTAAAILEIIAGRDIVNDAATADIPFNEVPQYTLACTSDGLRGARLGVPSNFIMARNLSQPVRTSFNAALDTMQSLGATVQHDTGFSAVDDNLTSLSDNEVLVLEVNFVTNLAQYFSKLYKNPQNITSLQDMLEHAKKDPREGYPDRNTLTWEAALNYNLTQTSPEYIKALTEMKWTGGDGTITGALDKYDLDAIIVPSDISYRVAAAGGLPIVTIPLGFYPEDTPVVWNDRHTLKTQAPNTPFGLSFIGRRFSEEKLIAYAYAFEAATQVRNKGPKPYIMPKTNLKDFVTKAKCA